MVQDIKDAFQSGAGFSADGVRLISAGLLVVVALLWFGFVCVSNYKLYSKGDIDGETLASQILNSLVIVMVFIILVLLV